MNLIENGNDNALLRVLQTPNAKKVQVSNTPDNSHGTYLEIDDDGTIHLGWIEDIAGGHVYYARSTNDGLTWWYIDATEFCAPYLLYCEIDPADVSLVMDITLELENIYILEDCHYMYVPLSPPPDFPYPLPPNAILWGTVNDPYFDQYLAYQYLIIDGMDFYKPMCIPNGLPIPPPLAPDLHVLEVSVTTPQSGPANDDSLPSAVTIVNWGTADVSGDISVELWEGENLIGSSTVTGLESEQTKTASFDWNVPDVWQTYELVGIVDPTGDIKEGDEGNNYRTVISPVLYDVTVVNTQISARSVPDGYDEFLPTPFFFDDYENVMKVTLRNTGTYPINGYKLCSILDIDDLELGYDLPPVEPSGDLVDLVVGAIDDYDFNPPNDILPSDILDDWVPAELILKLYDDYQTVEHPVQEFLKDATIVRPYADYDGDDLMNREEVFIYHTRPTIGDTDNDGIKDGPELEAWNIIDPDAWNVDWDDDYTINNLWDYDSDGDQVKDGYEFNGMLTTVNGEEIRVYSFPHRTNSDTDGLGDWAEFFYEKRTNPMSWDTDGDGRSDDNEMYQACYIPPYGDYVYSDPCEKDADKDGLLDFQESYITGYNTDPRDPDTDGDSMYDGVEHHFGMDPKFDESEAYDDGGLSGRTFKILVGFGWSFISDYHVGYTTTYWFDLWDIFGWTQDGRDNMVTVWKLSGIEFSSETEIAVHFGALVIGVDDFDDDPDMEGWSVSISGSTPYGFGVGLTFSIDSDGIGSFGGIVTIPPAWSVSVEHQVFNMDYMSLSMALADTLYDFLGTLSESVGIYDIEE